MHKWFPKINGIPRDQKRKSRVDQGRGEGGRNFFPVHLMLIKHKILSWIFLNSFLRNYRSEIIFLIHIFFYLTLTLSTFLSEAFSSFK